MAKITKNTPAATPTPAAPKAAVTKNTTVKDGKKVAPKEEPKPAAPAEVEVLGQTYRKGDIAEYIQAYVKEAGMAMPASLAKLAVEGYESFIGVCLKDGDQVITSLGKFYATDAPEKEGRNPATGEAITIAARRQPKMKVSATLKKIVNGQDEAEAEVDDTAEAETEATV